MATIRYQLADGHFYVIEVTEEFAAGIRRNGT